MNPQIILVFPRKITQSVDPVTDVTFNIFLERIAPKIEDNKISDVLPHFSMMDMENYKSLECYDRFVSGWVSDVQTAQIKKMNSAANADELYKLIRAKVNHSTFE